MRVLLVEDDRKASQVLTRGLQEEGWAVDTAHSAEVGGELARLNRYDAIVLDWMLPGKDGLSLCTELRRRGSNTPILMLTARDSVADRVAGLDTGADDYLAKPFAFDELLARLRALQRRATDARRPLLKVADLVVDPASHRVTRAGVEVELTPKEFAILELLVRHAGALVTRSRIRDAVWEGEPEDLGNLVDVHVSHLRRKVERAGSPLIHTVRGLGFRLGAS